MLKWLATCILKRDMHPVFYQMLVMHLQMVCSHFLAHPAAPKPPPHAQAAHSCRWWPQRCRSVISQFHHTRLMAGLNDTQYQDSNVVSCAAIGGGSKQCRRRQCRRAAICQPAAHSVALKQASRGGHQLIGARSSAALLCPTVMPDCWCALWPAFDSLAAPTGHSFDACLLQSVSAAGLPCGGGSTGGPANGQSRPVQGLTWRLSDASRPAGLIF